MSRDELTEARDDADVIDHTPATLLGWGAELLRLLSGLAAAYVPGGGGVDARTREQLIIAVSEANDCPVTAWVHASWLDYLGDREPDEALGPLFDYAQACAEAGRPLDTTTLDAVFPPAVVSSVRAVVARTTLVNMTEVSGRSLVESLAGSSDASLLRRVRNAAVFAAATPFLAPVMAAAAAMRTVSWLAPPLPDIELPGDEDANLVVHLLAEATPTYLSHALVRTGVVVSPVTVALGVRMEGSTATVRFGRGRVVVSEGIQPDVLLVLQGGTEPLLRVVASSIAGQLSNPRTLRRRG